MNKSRIFHERKILKICLAELAWGSQTQKFTITLSVRLLQLTDTSTQHIKQYINNTEQEILKKSIMIYLLYIDDCINNAKTNPTYPSSSIDNPICKSDN